MKLLEWKTGNLRKIPNHQNDSGLTDCLSLTEDLLVVSGYDLDTGSAALNLLYRDPELGDLSYLASLSDGEASRVISLSARLDRGALLIISGGHRVKIWSSLAESGQDQENVIRAQTRTLVCSQTLSDSELSEDEAPVGSEDSTRTRNKLNDKSSGFCNCNLM